MGMSKLMILGAGGHGTVVAEIADLMNKWDEIALLDDNKKLIAVNGYKVIGGLNDYKSYKEEYEYAIVALGNNKLRLELTEKLIREGITVPTLIHPFSSISATCHIGKGTVVMAGVAINANVTIGNACIINTSCSIDHGCVLEKGVHISPGVHLGGATYIEENTWICMGSSISNNIKIGKNVIVAAGAAVINDIPDNVMAAGVPAEIKREFGVIQE